MRPKLAEGRGTRYEMIQYTHAIVDASAHAGAKFHRHRTYTSMACAYQCLPPPPLSATPTITTTGACVASAAIHQCSCFTAAPRIIHVASNSKTRCTSSVRFSTSRSPSSAATPPSPSAAAAAAAKGGDDTAAATTRHRRRKTVLSYGRTADAAAADVEERSTSQQLQAEVAARRSRAWGLVGFPPPSEGLFGEADSSPTAAGGRGGAAVEGDAADTAIRERRQDRDREEEEEEQRRLLDMTHPPPELLTAAQKHSVGDTRAATAVAERQEDQQSAGGGQGNGEEDGASMWASRGMLAGAAMLYGTNFGCVKLLEESVPMSLAAALRFSVALVPFIPFLKKVNPGVFKAGAEVRHIGRRANHNAEKESLALRTDCVTWFPDNGLVLILQYSYIDF